MTNYYDTKLGQESHNAAGASGNFGRHCAAHQAVPPRVRQGGGGHQHGPDGVRGGVGERLLLVVHHTQQISKAAVAGDADNINKQARKERTDWINKQKNKQATNGFLSSAPVGGARAA